MKKRSAEAWAGIIAGLEGDRATVAEQEATAATEARPLALPASTGDRTAAAQLMQINDRRAALIRQAETLDVALADARDRLAAVQQVEADIQTAARRAALREASGEMVNHAAAVDAAARVLAQAMGDYDQHLLVMSRMGLDATQYRRLSNRTMIAGALHLEAVMDLRSVARPV